jgi:hypothetical protein
MIRSNIRKPDRGNFNILPHKATIAMGVPCKQLAYTAAAKKDGGRWH